MAGTCERVHAVASMRSVGGCSVFDPKVPVDAARAGAFLASLDETRHVADVLLRQGFDITHFHPLALSFSGTPETFRDTFGVRMDRHSRSGGRGRTIEAFSPDIDDVWKLLDLPRAFGGHAEGIAIACPPRLVDDAGLPLRAVDADDRPGTCLADEIAISIWGKGRPAIEATGNDVVAAMIGTGCYRHGFFAERRYRLLPTLLGPGQFAALEDRDGHSTGEASCLFATAPNLRLRPIKGLVDPVGDMLMAIDSAPMPGLIVNSWGHDVDPMSWDQLRTDDPNLHNYLRLLDATIAHATAKGILVVAAVPEAWQSALASHPDVIALGAAGRPTMPKHLALTKSTLREGRHVPDFWSTAEGAVVGGSEACSTYLQPSQPGSACCRLKGAKIANGLRARDDRRDLARRAEIIPSLADEGWTTCDPSQAAFPMAAGLIALVLEQHPEIRPEEVKGLLADAAGELAKAHLTSPSEASDTAVRVDVTPTDRDITSPDEGDITDHVGIIRSAIEPEALRLGA